MLDNGVEALEPVRKELLNPESPDKRTLCSDSKSLASHNPLVSVSMEGSTIQTESNVASLKTSGVDNILSSSLSVDTILANLPEEASPSKRPCATSLTSQEETRCLNSPKNGKAQTFLCRPKLCMKQPNMHTSASPYNVENNNMKSSKTRNNETGSGSSPFVAEYTASLEHIMLDDGIQPKDQELVVSKTASIQKNDTSQTRVSRSRGNSIHVPKVQEGRVNIKRSTKLNNPLERERLARSSRKQELHVTRNPKEIQNEKTRKHMPRRIGQMRSNGVSSGKVASLFPEATTRQSSLLKAGLKKKVENIGLAEPGLKEKVRNIAKMALCEAGFKIELRPRRGKDYLDSVYISPKGYRYWSLPKAWRALKEIQAEFATRDSENIKKRPSRNDKDVSDVNPNGTLSGKKKQKKDLENKVGMEQLTLLIDDSESNVLRALKSPDNRSGHQQVTNAELTDLFVEDLKFFRRLTKQARARMAEEGALDKPIKEIETKRKATALSTMKLDFEKASRHEGVSRKRTLGSVTDPSGAGGKRQKIEDLKVKSSLNHVPSFNKSQLKAHETDDRKENINGAKFLKQRKENMNGAVSKKLFLKTSHEKLWMNAPIRDLIEKNRHFERRRKGDSLLTKPASKDFNSSCEKLHNNSHSIQDSRLSHESAKHIVLDAEVKSRKKGLHKEKIAVSDSVSRKCKLACLDSFPLKSKKSKAVSDKNVAPDVRTAKNQVMHSGCRLKVRGAASREGEGSDIESLRDKQTVLSWLIERGVLSEREKLHCLTGDDLQSYEKRGLAIDDGILCKCCKRTFTISEFMAHAGCKYRTERSIIILKSGNSLLDCQIQAWEIETELRKVNNYVGVTEDDPNDDTCMLCGDGGELICCDHCPSTFHASCLRIQGIPEGNWFCPKCCCHVCGQSQYDDNAESTSRSLVRFCDQCEHEYHVSCIHGGGIIEKNHWFCGLSCHEIFTSLHNLVGITHPLDQGLSWTLLRCMDKDQGINASEDLETTIKLRSKLAVALNVMQECFVRMVDPRTNVDMIPHVVYNRGLEFSRLDYQGFYTVVLEKGDELISVASIRIHGSQLAEMPLIGTRQQYRRQGMCRRLVNAIEMMLSSLGIELFVLPAIPELLETWTCAFGFEPIDARQRLNFKTLSMMVFPGTQLLQKALVRADGMQNNMIPCPDMQTTEPVSCLQNVLDCKQESPEALEFETSLSIQMKANTEHRVLSRDKSPDLNSTKPMIYDGADDASVEHFTFCQNVPCSPTFSDKLKKSASSLEVFQLDQTDDQSTGNGINEPGRLNIVEKSASNVEALNLDQTDDQSTGNDMNDLIRLNKVKESACSLETLQSDLIHNQSTKNDMNELDRMNKKTFVLTHHQIEETIDPQI